MKNILLFCSIAFVMSCQNSTERDVAVKIHSTGDTIIISSKSNLIDKIKTAKVIPEQYRNKIITSGIVKAIPNNYAEIASPFSGRIIRSFVCLGQKVEVGSPVFEISSPSFFEAGKSYYQTKQEMQLAEKNLKRQQDLFNNGVGIQKNLEEAEVNYELTKRDYENSVASLKVYQVNPEELVLGQPLIVRAPIKGEIVENKIVIGQYLKEDAAPVAIVAELSSVWVIGQLKEKDINSVHKDNDVEIRLTGMPELPMKGKVFHMGEILDEETRSVQVHVLCQNNDRIMKPGMFVTAQFSTISENKILIPSSAVLQLEDSSFVFIALGKHKFLRRPVEVAGTDNDHVILKSGLNPSDEIVVQGGIYLLEAM
jgi:membrane fusion protein, heavy metal efflux system